ncbi:MAG: 1,4-alpha-glucan branching protein GlgB [Mucilaginibacter polytrichastri]|nr:1,4-alpha-glucan branching protein GlgB [Mucilaginibacter polytrichastri]
MSAKRSAKSINPETTESPLPAAGEPKKSTAKKTGVKKAPEDATVPKKAPAKKAGVAAAEKKPAVKSTGEEAVPAKKTSVKKAAPADKPAGKSASKKSIAEKTGVKTAPALQNVEAYTRFSEFDIGLFLSGKHYRLYELFGSHVVEHQGVVGTYFAVWAPNAQYVSVIGNFNGWNPGSHKLFVRWDSSGIWEGFIPNVGNGEVYKYHISSNSGEELQKGDPFALRWEVPPRTASVVSDTWYAWNDPVWMKDRYRQNSLQSPFSVYEVHFGSWARSPEDPDTFLSYRDMAEKLVSYVQDMAFTHVEFMPLAEHPFYPSWGYQITGYFAASSRYGSPQDLMYLIDCFHQAGIGVIMDWVPSHFPGDAHGLYRFDGSHLYEHADMRKGFHPDWKSYIFNYGRNEVRAFLISNAFFWLDRYHIDGLRVDAVASMLYLDYSRNHGEWEPNIFGGNENLEAISLLKEFNEAVYGHFPDVQTIAEESTSFYGVSRPLYSGGLGFGMKWMMGWMNDALTYFKQDPIHRKFHHNQITFSLVYAFTENFMLPLSHDEVVHGKQSLIYKMPGDEWQRFANLRTLYSLMFTHPGSKLLFMGDEFAQTSEWNVQQSLDWHLLEYAPHFGVQALVRELNHLYRNQPALHERSFEQEGFEWIESADGENSVIAYRRKGFKTKDDLIVVCNFTPVVREEYRVGVADGEWEEIFSSDEARFGGSDIRNGKCASEEYSWNFKPKSISVKLPALATIVLRKLR